MKVIVSGGGTGGHIFPAIAVADCLKSRLPDVDILFVGAKGKMEMEKVPKAGYPIEGYWITGLQRKLSFRNLVFPFKLISSLWRARKIIRQFSPDVVAGFGGFASGPVLEVAVRRKIPTVIQEQNSFAGITNKLLGKRVRRICVAYPEMEKYFPKEKIVMTGNPIRKDLLKLEAKKVDALNHFGLDPEKKTLLIFGGSLGAKALNEAMRDATRILKERNNTQVLWQMGKLYTESYRETDTGRLPNVHPVKFIDRMDLAYVVADLVMCRAGASTIAELAQVGKAALLVPSPNVAENHQMYNAMALLKKDAAALGEDREGAELLARAMEMLGDEPLLTRLSARIREFAIADAAERIVDEIIGVTEMA